MIGWRFLISCLLVLGLLTSWPAQAEDPPASLVGRVAAVDGVLTVRSAGEWRDAAVNHPIASGMAVRTTPQGRAVLRIGAETIALAAGTELDLTRLAAGDLRIVLRQGRIGVRLSPLDPVGKTEIDIARGSVRLLSAGDYDITAGDGHLPARIAVFSGSAHFVGKGTDSVTAAGSVTVLGGGSPPAVSHDSAIADGFVAWWRPAAGDDANGQAVRYLSPDMTGYATLDASGSWETVDGYGAVWFPTTVPADWAPYRDGHWRWIAPWGWNWIDAMPWGFATSHYGRWASIPGADPGTERWGWVPGSRIAHPVYAPALVAFLGTAGVGLSCPDASGPAVAWFPLAPGEPYWPGYTSDLNTIRRINDGVVADVSTIGPAVNGGPPADIVNGKYRNRRFATVVPRPVFVAGRPVAPALVQLPDQRLDNAPLLAGSPLIMPPAPHPAAIATASAAARPRLARVLHTAGRMVQAHRPATPTRAATLVRAGRGRLRVRLATSSHWRVPAGHLVRPHPIAAERVRELRGNGRIRRIHHAAGPGHHRSGHMAAIRHLRGA